MSDPLRTSVLSRDARYEDVFDVTAEVRRRGGTVVDDPHPAFHQLRAQGPVLPGSISSHLLGHEGGHRYDDNIPHVSIFGYEAAVAAFRDNDTYSSESYHLLAGHIKSIGHTILDMGGEEHRRNRAIVQPMTSPRMAKAWWTEKWIGPIVDTIIDELEHQDQADINLDLCARVPVHTVTNALGLRPELGIEFRDAMVRSMEHEADEAVRDVARQEVRDIIEDLIASRRADPKDDIVSQLLAAELDDGAGGTTRLDDEAILSFCRLLLLAGGGTTWRQMSITLFALLTTPGLWDEVREDRALLAPLVQESVRWNSNQPIMYRLAKRDSVLEGVEIPAGTIVDIGIAAANRDPSRWERPDEFDVHRPAQRHLGFAGGIHACLGRYVSEAEMTYAINALLDRFPSMRLDDTAPPPQITGGIDVRAVSHLRVRTR